MYYNFTFTIHPKTDNHSPFMFLIYFLLCAFILSSQNQERPYRIEGTAQGTTYRILYYSDDSLVTKSEIDILLAGIDSSLSLYKPYSLINQFNQGQGPIKMDAHFESVYYASLNTWKDTRGLFDITVKPLVQAWGFGVKKSTNVPNKDTIARILACTGSQQLTTRGNQLFKRMPCVQIDMNGIAQGYSVDQIAFLLEKKGLQNYLVELGGEIRVKGRKGASGEMFRVGIESPQTNEWDLNTLQRQIKLPEGAITTSGSYRNYYESEGKTLSHIIDPRTGYPVSTNLISVTVWAKDAMTADAYDNALMLMGMEQAMEFIESKKEMAAYFIYKDQHGEIKDTASTTFLRFFKF